MNQQQANELNETVRIILTRNLESKLTVDLASGMYTNIIGAIAGFVQPERAEEAGVTPVTST
jgi:hypothetical protein